VITRTRSIAHELPKDPTQSRRLLLHRKEIEYLRTKALEKGLTIIPLSVYSKSRLIKVELAVGKGKHTFDKRETLKKRDIDRDTKRIIKEL
jgi:SsrA-binding protein